MDDFITADMDRRRRITRQVHIRLAAVVFLVLVVVLNDEVIMRALFMALLVPLMRDFQKRLNTAAVYRHTAEVLHHAARGTDKQR